MVNCAAFSPDAARLVLCEGWNLTLRDASGRRIAQETTFASEIWAVAFSSDGTRIAAVAYDGSAAILAVG